MANNLESIFKTLDFLSEFSRGQPRHGNLNKSNCKAINSTSVSKIQTLKTDKKKQDKNNRSVSIEEKEFARQIGYELNSDDDNASDVYDDDEDDYDDYDVNHLKTVVENNSLKKHFKENGSDFNHKKQYSRSSDNITGFTVGRGQWLNSDTLPLSTFSYNKSSFHQNRQEQNDRVISAQLREVVGVGVSNEEIENDFALKFKKKSSKETQNVEESDHKKENYTFNNSDSIVSSNFKHKPLKCKYELYVPPALRSTNNSVSESERNCMVSTSANSDSCNNVPNYSELELKKKKLKILSPIKLNASEINNIYECSSDCIELENNSNLNNPSSSQTNNDSDNTKNIMIDTICLYNGEKQTNASSKLLEKESKLSFRMKSKELLKNSSKFGGGRNALINGLLKKLAKVEEDKEGEEKKEVTVLTTKEENLEVNNGNVFENYYTYKEQSDDYDLSSFDSFNSINSDSSNNVSRCVSRNSVSSPCNQVLNNFTASTTADIAYPTTSNSTNSTAYPKQKKTYVEQILKSSQKLQNITLADFIPENMLNIIAKDSDLNPNANEFNPQLVNFLNPNANEFNPCNFSSNSDSFCTDDFNFPPLK